MNYTDKLPPNSWCTWQTPFTANSLWNSRPNNPVLSAPCIRPTNVPQYYPQIGEDNLSLKVHRVDATDTPMTVYGLDPNGVWDPDSRTYHNVRVPHWPKQVTLATGGDGHCDIIDTANMLVHSFWQLRFDNGKYAAQQWCCSKLNGTGWPEPGHYFQGARAAAVPSCGGLMRYDEVSGSQASLNMYYHALAVSLDKTSLAKTFCFPATSCDNDSAWVNTGSVPEGGLLMLPDSFPTSSINNPLIQKVVETLKVFGARVVDRNGDTPYKIYAEIGSGFQLHKTGWNNQDAADLRLIESALCMMTSCDGYYDGNLNKFQPNKNLNLLSMRGGPWYLVSGNPGTVAPYDTYMQAISFPRSPIETIQYNSTNAGFTIPDWAVPKAGDRMRLTAHCTGGASLRLQIADRANPPNTIGILDSGFMTDKKVWDFKWPAEGLNNSYFTLYAKSGINVASAVGGYLVRLA